MAAWDVIGKIRIGLLETEIRTALLLAVQHGCDTRRYCPCYQRHSSLCRCVKSPHRP